MKSKKVIGVAFVLVVFGALTAFGISRARDNSTGNGGKVAVSATYYPLYDFAQKVGGDKVEVSNITPAGAEPHEYEPTPEQLVSANKSDLLVYNGGRMEPWIDKFLADYKHTAVKASQGIDLQMVEDEGNPAEKVKDPHFWLDPLLAQTIVDNIRDGLSKTDPANKDLYASNAATYKAELAKLDNEFKTGLAHCGLRTVVTSHDAFSYLAKRYSLGIASIAGISPEEEPSAAKLAELTQLVRTKGINYVFFESLVSPRLADTIAHETGAKTLVFDPIEGLSDEDQKQGKDYVAVQRENLQNLRTALACQ